MFNAYLKKKKCGFPHLPGVTWQLQREWEEGTGEIWPPFCFHHVISGDPVEGELRNEKKPVTNEVPRGVEISWSHYLILFREKPFNFLLLKRSNLLLVAKLPKLIESWLVSPRFSIVPASCWNIAECHMLPTQKREHRRQDPLNCFFFLTGLLT